MNTGNRVKYLFFWGHKKELNISKSCLSHWYDAPFKINNIVYKMAEHYMMSEKALLFCDQEIYQKIIQANHPSEAKKLGRIVKNFDQEIWRNHRSNIVIKGNLAKFSQNTDLKEFLMKTGDRVLVEASPRDRIWGIGLASDYSVVENPNLWKGLNLLGFALMEVREQFK